MNRLLPILGIFLTLGATAATVAMSDAYLEGNLERQRRILERERTALRLPTAPGPPAMSRAAEVWLFPGEALVNLSTLDVLDQRYPDRQVRTLKRTWRAERHPLDDSDSPAPHNGRYDRYRVWTSPINRDLAIASTWLAGRNPWSQTGPTQVRILAHPDVTWSEVSGMARRSQDVNLPRIALGLANPEGPTSEWRITEGTCDAVTLHLTTSAVRRTVRWREHQAAWETCAADDCSDAITALLNKHDANQSDPSNLCLQPYGDVPISKVAGALRALEALDTAVLLNLR